MVAPPRQKAAPTLVGLGLLLALLPLWHRPGGSTTAPATESAHTAGPTAPLDSYGRLPLAFEPNVGQAPDGVDYIARARGYSVALDGRTVRLGLLGLSSERLGATVSIRAEGTAGAARPVADALLPGRVNYLLGDDPGKWHRHVPTASTVRYPGVYPGIDQVFHGTVDGDLEYTFELAPHADPGVISLSLEGVETLTTAANGDLVLALGTGSPLIQRAPHAYQMVDGARHEVPVRYAVNERFRIGFAVGPYDRALPLLIDPVLSYSTYLGGVGGGEAGEGIVVDSAGNAYIAGYTTSTDFPVTPGAHDGQKAGQTDAFVAKLNPSGTALVWSTYLGGTDSPSGEIAHSVAVDDTGSPFVTGVTGSSDFPTTPGAFDRQWSGEEVFVTKLTADGSALEYSTFIGLGVGLDVVVDGSGNAYLTGLTLSTTFPTTPGAFQTACAGGQDCGSAFVTKLNPTGSALEYSTYLGGANGSDAGRDLVIDDGGNAYIAGTTGSDFFPTVNAYQPTCDGCEYFRADAFVTKLNPTGTALVYSTYLGGSLSDSGAGIAIDGGGNAYVTGQTKSSDFDTTPGTFQPTYQGSFDAYVTKLAPSGSSLVYSTHLGGSLTDEAFAVKVDSAGNTVVVGKTKSSDFPTQDTVQGVCGCQGSYDAFVTALNPSGSALVYSTFLGGISLDEGYDVALNEASDAYVTGLTYAMDFPTTPGALDTSTSGEGDAFVAKLGDTRLCTITGTPGDDVLTGGPADEVICGLGGNDILNGRGGGDILFGDRGNDILNGGPGANTLDGGAGMDGANYAEASAAVTVDLAAGTATGPSSDTLVAIERVLGSRFGDRMWGDGSPNLLSGRAGNDAIAGRAGNDRLLGEGGDDILAGGNGFDRCHGGTGTNQLTSCEA